MQRLLHPGDEYGIKWDDPNLGIQWPTTVEPIISEKDAALPVFAAAKYFA